MPGHGCSCLWLCTYLLHSAAQGAEIHSLRRADTQRHRCQGLLCSVSTDFFHAESFLLLTILQYRFLYAVFEQMEQPSQVTVRLAGSFVGCRTSSRQPSDDRSAATNIDVQLSRRAQPPSPEPKRLTFQT